MFKISIEKTLYYLLVFFLIFTPIKFVPEWFSSLLRYLFAFLGIWYLLFYKKKFATTKFHVLVYLYFVLACFSLLFSPYLNMNLVLSYIQFVLILFVIVNYNVINNIRDVFETFFNVLSKIVCLATVYSIILIVFGSYSYENGSQNNYFIFGFLNQSIHGVSQTDYGYSSFYTNPNIFGYYCMVLLCYLLFVKKSQKKMYVCFYWLCCIAGISLANSRAIIIISFIIIAIFIFYKLPPRGRYILFPAVLAMAIIVLYFVFKSGMLSDAEFLTGRLEMWNEMIEAIKKYPLFGIGFSASTKYLVGNLQHRVGSHNSYLSILCENGIIGFIVFLFILILISTYILKNMKNKYNNMDKIYLFSVCIILSSLPYAFFENQFMILDSRNILWMLCCLIVVYKQKKVKNGSVLMENVKNK